MRTLRTITAVLAVLILAACGTGGGASPTSAVATQAPATTAAATEASPTADTTESPDESPSPDDAGEITVDVASSDLGEILVDGEGRTLYGFMNDTDGEPTCYDQCEQNWPPLTVEGEIEVGEGLDDSDLSTVERTDGTMQVKIGDWPLYYFANDTAPGDTNGQGVGGVWFVVGPDGELIRE